MPTPRGLLIFMTVVSAANLSWSSGQTIAETCLWEGLAPTCKGECKPGYALLKRDKEGDGMKCVTGTKAYCCKASGVVVRGTAPACKGKCKAGEEMLGESDRGANGIKCLTGKAAICRLAVE